jgi:DNA-binding IclR family transcriptional regulator
MQSEGTRKNQSLRKALEILEAMSALDGPERLHNIAALVDMSPSTVLRFLNTYADYGYVTQDPDSGLYYLTLKLALLGSQTRAHFPFQQALKKYVRRVSERFHETASLCVESDMRMVYVIVEDGPEHMLQTLSRIGRVAPIHATGVGKILLLNYSEEQLHTLMAVRGLPEFTPRTITGLEALKRELEQVREQGFAVDDEECEVGVRCVAVPVRDLNRSVAASISLSAPVSRLDSEKFDQVTLFLKDIGRQASAEMGYPGDSADG